MKLTLIILSSILTISLSWYIITLKKRKLKQQLKKNILEDGISDYRKTTTNFVNSISQSKKLYKKLIIQIHPDKFQGENKAIAEAISSRLTTSQRDYNSLCLIEKEIDLFLKNNYNG